MTHNRIARVLIVAVALVSSLVATSHPAAAQATDAKPTIVLVHGAFADASGWSKVIPLLEREGYRVVAVQNALTSYAADVATTRRVVDAEAGPVVLVGHSYGGAVITGAAVGAKNVKALVYVAAFGPDAGEMMMPLLQKYPSKIGAALVPDAAGYLYIDRVKFKESFAGDVSEAEWRVMAVTQKPINGEIFGHTFGAPAWKTIPTWYLVATQDQAINPELQRMFATRMRATVREVTASHVPFVSKPDAVAAIIGAAAAAPPAAAAQR